MRSISSSAYMGWYLAILQETVLGHHVFRNWKGLECVKKMSAPDASASYIHQSDNNQMPGPTFWHLHIQCDFKFKMAQAKRTSLIIFRTLKDHCKTFEALFEFKPKLAFVCYCDLVFNLAFIAFKFRTVSHSLKCILWILDKQSSIFFRQG